MSLLMQYPIGLALDSLSTPLDFLASLVGTREMLKLFKSVMPRKKSSEKSPSTLRSVRPSLLDLRFTGDPWVVDDDDGAAVVQLDDYRLARIQAMPFDLPSLNQLLLQLRQWQVRRCFYRQCRALGQPYVLEAASSP